MKKASRPLFLSLAVVALVVATVPLADARNVRSSGRTSVNRGGSVNRNTNINRNTNVNVNRNVNVHGGYYGGGYYGGGCCYHPVATAAAVTATAMVTSAVIGSITHSLPSGCSSVMVNGFAYQQCGSTWYQPQLSGSSTTYVVVNAPR
jgi:Family of unknown function (DUF6515)